MEHHRNVPQTPLSASNKAKESNSPSSISSSSSSTSTPAEKEAEATTTTIINNRSVTVVNQATVEEDERSECAIDASKREQKKEEEQLQTTSTIKHIAQIAYSENSQQPDQKMSSDDDESENDSELLNTLSQLHGLVQSPRASFIQSADDENDLSPVSDAFQKRTIIFHNGLEKSTNNHQTKTGNSFSLTSSTSSMQFTDDELQVNDLGLNSQASLPSLLADDEPGPTFPTNHEDDTLQNESLSDMSSAIVIPIVDKLISDSIQAALVTVHQYTQHVEQLVNRVLTEAVDQVYREDYESSDVEDGEQTFDPFDRKFDHLWSEQFQTFNGDLFSNGIESEGDAWFTATQVPTDRMSFESTGSPSPSAVHSQDSPPAALLIDLSDSVVKGNDSLRYCLTASVKANNLDDSSAFPDSALSQVIDFGRHGFSFSQPGSNLETLFAAPLSAHCSLPIRSCRSSPFAKTRPSSI